MKFISDCIRGSKIKKNTSLFASVGSNDVFPIGGKSVESETVYANYKELLRTMKEKSNHCFLLGILPRRSSTNLQKSRAISLNTRLEELCKMNDVQFIDTWNLFYGNSSLYKYDGTHLNSYGTKVLADVIGNSIKRNPNRSPSAPPLEEPHTPPT